MAEEIKKEKEEQKDKEGKLESRKLKILEKIKIWFKNPYNRALFGILLLALGIRLFYFFMVKQQPLWFDEAEYMAQAKRWAFGYDWYWKASIRKPILMTFLFSLLYKIGFKEIGFRILMLLTSFAAVYLTYLVAKDFFDKKIGLIAAFLMSTWWVHLFFTIRLLTELPTSTLLLAAVHFFYKGYVKKEGLKNIVWFGVFFAIAFLMRVTLGIMIIPIFLYILMEEKWHFLKNKNLWIAALMVLIIVSPFFIWLFNVSPDNIGTTLYNFLGIKQRFTFTSMGEGAMGAQGIPLYFQDLPNILKTPLFLIFLVGSIILIADLVLGFDLIFKKEYKELRIKLFVLLWVLLPIIAFALTRAYVEQRDAMVFSVFLFSAVGVGAMKLYDLIKKYNKIFAAMLVIGLLILGSYPQLTYGYELIKLKKDSYAPIKEAGLWLKEYDSNHSDYVATKSIPQINYYSEINGYDILGNTEEEFMKIMSEKNVRFFSPSTFEPYYLAPEWSYTWGQRHPEIAKPVWWWFDNPEQPRQFVIIYELDWSAYRASLNNTNASANLTA